MKKLLSILIILSITMACIIGNALAEGFSLHSEVQFGMSMDEIIKIENDHGFSFEKTTISSKSNYFPANTECLYCGGVTAAGYDDSNIYYFFDSDGKMNAMVYMASDFWREPIDNERIIATLDEKYGMPIGDHSRFVDFKGSAIDALSMYYRYTRSYDEPILTLFSQWSTALPDGSCVDIQVLQCRNNGNFNRRFISYSLRTAEEVKAVEDELNQQNQSMNDDL